MNEPQFKIVETLDDYLKVHAVRAIVFLHEQHCPYDIEIDEYEQSSAHILVEQEGEPIGVGRIRFYADYAKLERIAVRKEWRGRGLGHQLVDFLMDYCKAKGFQKFRMHAQAHLVDYYAQHGFVRRGELFIEAGIDHYLMIAPGE